MRRLRAMRAVASAERGAALVMTLLVLVILTAFGLTLVGLGMTEVSISSNWRDYSKDFYAAEATLENGVVGLKTLLETNPTPSQTDLNGIAAPTLTDPKLTFGAYSISAPSPTFATTFPSGHVYAGLTGLVTAYQIRAQVNGQGGTRADLTQVFQYMEVPLFQFGVFYGKGVDLEIAPGPDMTFNGRGHANSNIYVGAGNTLKFDSYITTAGGIYRTLKRENPGPYPPASYSPWSNHPKIKKPSSAAYEDLDFDSKYQEGFSSTWASPEDWAAQANSTFGGTVKDGAMGVMEITPPIPELFKPKEPGDPDYRPPDVIAHQMIELPKAGDDAALASAKLYSKAQVRVIDGVATGLTCGAAPAGAITTSSFYDAREAKTVNAIQLDVNLLRTNGCIPNSAVVYVASTAEVTGSTIPAVRLVNAERLPTGGMTVVSQNPVYVKGDYNKLDKVPAAIMADAITVLSQNWDDSKGNLAKSERKARRTEVNAAFALGPGAESSQGQGNGQLENSIRFLEEWGSAAGNDELDGRPGKTFRYNGSIIALWHSLQANSQWACCVYYGPPRRDWSYDTSFSTTPPPGTPRGIIMMKGRWSQQ